MSPAALEAPLGAFVLAVGGAAATATAMIGVAALSGGMSAIDVPAALLVVGLALIGATLVIAPAAALVGLPLTWLLARTGRESGWAYPVVGLISGGAIAVGFFHLVELGASPEPLRPGLDAAPFGALPGLVCGLLWWSLYRRDLGKAPGR